MKIEFSYMHHEHYYRNLVVNLLHPDKVLTAAYYKPKFYYIRVVDVTDKYRFVDYKDSCDCIYLGCMIICESRDEYTVINELMQKKYK